jgi:uncharacterized protein YdeI (YjbR/CyaY-like superfamily)
MVAPRFFRTPTAFRKWLEINRAGAPALLVGFYRVGSGKGGLTYQEALDEALCFGWIDGVRKRYDADSYAIRFAPRTQDSIWSVINTRRMEELIEKGRPHESGLRAFEKRDKKKSKLYSYEVRSSYHFSASYEKQFRSQRAAWEFYQAQAPWYRRVTCHWVMSAKREETRLRRLSMLMEDSSHQRRIKQLIPNRKKPE